MTVFSQDFTLADQSYDLEVFVDLDNGETDIFLFSLTLKFTG